MKNNKPLLHSLRIALLVLAGLIIYAYGFDITEVNLDKTREPRRQDSFVRILRALAHPDIFQYEQDEFTVHQPIYIPCPENLDTMDIPEPALGEPYMVITPPCADPNTEVQVEGFNFAPNTTGPINFIPPSAVRIQVGELRTDSEGHFETTVRLPRRQPVEEAQHLMAITRTNVGSPQLSQNGLATWNLILETIFLALLATTLGTLLAIPISFLAARNIMRDVSSPLASISLTILAWPAGIGIGILAAQWANNVSLALTENALLNVFGLLVSPLVVWGTVRWALPQEDLRRPTPGLRIGRLLALIVAALAGILGVFLLAILAERFGTQIARPLGPLGFLGTFISSLGDITSTILTAVVALSVGGLLSSWAGRLGDFITGRVKGTALQLVNLFLGALAGAILFALIGAAIDWFYQVRNPLVIFWIPALVGALGGILVVLRTRNKEAVPVGLSVYYVMRTILNTLRSIEAFIMAIIFVVLVGTGPFAGVLALSLHTMAALAKLYSEQVESILPGPIEAIKATGATRLQTVIYAVIPQIVPPYISFTMYRWDINVRMSTIIGFVGGGGIGLLLQQNINLLNYRGAAAQMLAITIVVAAMDYVSSVMRERVV